MAVNVEDYQKQTDCAYKEEHYSVRDNGAVLRHARNIRSRPTDNLWTFGKPNDKTGYMEIATARIHRIVATAFHGDPPTKEHVVDHIDTNKRNNRPENLRWVTRLENILLNPITIKRIESACGCSVEEFLADPKKFRDKFQDPNYEWMCTVTAEEAQTSLKRMQSWAESNKRPSGGSLGQWIFNRGTLNQSIEEESEFTTSLTPNAVQKNWKTPSKFPLCPQPSSDNPIADYTSSLSVDKIISTNQYSSSIVVDFASSKEKNTLWVLCKSSDVNAVKPFSLMQITYENSLFVHTSLGSFFRRDGAEKEFTLAQGLEWIGGDTFDDLC
jgi:hypothetical protein